MFKNFDDDANLNINGVVYRCSNDRVSKSEAINLLKKKRWFNQKKQDFIKYKFLFIIYKNCQKIIKFGETEIEKHKFHKRKNSISIFNVDINGILVSNKVSLDKYFRYFIGY